MSSKLHQPAASAALRLCPLERANHCCNSHVACLAADLWAAASGPSPPASQQMSGQQLQAPAPESRSQHWPATQLPALPVCRSLGSSASIHAVTVLLSEGLDHLPVLAQP